MGPSHVQRLYAASHSNHNINSNSDGLFWNTRSNRGLSDVSINCGSCSWNFTVETKSVKQMALQTCQNSLSDMVVCFPLRRNSLPPNVRRLSLFFSPYVGVGGF